MHFYGKDHYTGKAIFTLISVITLISKVSENILYDSLSNRTEKL